VDPLSTTGKSSRSLNLTSGYQGRITTKVQGFYLVFRNHITVAREKKNQQITKPDYENLKGLFKYEFNKVDWFKAHRVKVRQHTTVRIPLGGSPKSTGLESTSKLLLLEIGLSAYFSSFRFQNMVLVFYSRLSKGIHLYSHTFHSLLPETHLLRCPSLATHELPVKWLLVTIIKQ